MDKKQTIDGILERYRRFSPIGGVPIGYVNTELQVARQDLADLILGLPSLQDKDGIQKGSKEHIIGEICPECGYGYIGELGGCICVTDDDLRYRICQEIAEALGVKNEK